MRDLLMVIPSRGRPHNIERLSAAADATCQGDTWFEIGLDQDDPTAGQYPAGRLLSYTLEHNLRKVTAWCNHLAVPEASAFRYIGHFGDDNVPVTPGWDVAMMESLEKAPFAFANDEYPSRTPGTLSCHIFMRSDVVRTLGYFGPPSIAHMYVDVAWYAWGTACGIIYRDDIHIPHLHYSAGKAAHDETYQTSFGGTSDDLQAWHAYCRSGQLNMDIHLLGGEPFTEAALADFNRALNIPETWPW